MPTDYKQTDPRWNYLPFAGENINNAGCGPTSCSDGLDITPDVTAAWISGHGYASDGSGTFWEGIPACLKAFGQECTQLCYDSQLGKYQSAVFDKFLNNLRSGYCGVLLMGNGGSPVKWTSGGHYIFAADYNDANGTILIYDPASTPRTTWHPWSDFLPSVKIAYTTKIPTISAPVSGYSYEFEMEWLHAADKNLPMSQGPKVLLVQKVWKAIGVYKYSLDGKYENGTKGACIKWQELHSLGQDGSCGLATQRTIFKLQNRDYKFYVRHIKKGSTGDSVVLAQCIMKADGYYKGAIDGDFGGMTEEAVKWYQRVKRAEGKYEGAIDGDIDTLTWKCLIGF